MSVVYIRNWWVMAFRGLVAGLLGLLAFFLPSATSPQALAVLSLLFGAFVLINGLFVLRIAFLERGRNEHWRKLEHWWLPLLEGAIGVVIGFVILAWSSISMTMLLSIIIVWAIVNGLIELGSAIWLRNLFADEVLLMVGGILSLIFGLIFLFRMHAPPLAVLWLFGVFAISIGVLYTMFAFRLKNLIEVKVDTSRHTVEQVIPGRDNDARM